MSSKIIKFPVSFPRDGAGGKTGLWRVERPQVDLSNCTYCGLCSMYCPSASIVVSIRERKLEINYEYCKGCGICASVCPKGAIIMVPE